MTSPPASSTDPRSDLLEGYLQDLAHQRRVSAHTGRNYRHAGQKLLEMTPGLSLDRLTSAVARRLVAQLHGEGLSGRTLALMLSAWRGWFEWLARHHGFEANPFEGIRPPKASRKLPKTLSPDEAARLLESRDCRVPDDAATAEPLVLRNRAMFELLYSSGLRLSELVGLDVHQARDVVSQSEVTVVGKGRKTRTVPVGSKAVLALREWLQVRPSLAQPEEAALFVGSRGARIAPRVVQAELRAWGIRQGLGTGVHPHALRHSFASHVLQSSQDLRAVQEMLGHASISTTQVYTHLDFQSLAKAYDAAHPRARKKPAAR